MQAQNEFSSNDYSMKPDPTQPNKPLGDIYLEAYEFTLDKAYLWAAIIYLLFVFVAFALCGAVAVRTVRYERNVGTSRIASEEEEEEVAPAAAAVGEPTKGATVAPAPADATALPVDSTPASVPSSTSTSNGGAHPTGHALAFTPVSLTFKDITYDVQLPRKLGGGKRRLLRGVSGYSAPGTMTALMGASGAGKTTLLDCLAGRKNAGWLTGNVLINGHTVDKATFSRLSCYVEQADVHLAHATVREALEFSAALRLPPSIPTPTKAAFIDEVRHTKAQQ